MSKAKRRLGKGLEALLPSTMDEPQGGEGLRQIPVDQIRPNPHQPRREFDKQALAELAASIRQHGVVQPVVVTADPDGFTLVAGERRWRAARMAGLTTVPAVVKQMEPMAMTAVALIENLQREDLTPLEEAQAYLALQDNFDLTQEQIAATVGKSRSQIANTLRLLQLEPRVQEMLARQEITMGHAKVLLSVADGQRQLSLARAVRDEGLTVRKLEERLQQAITGRRGKPRPARRTPSRQGDPILAGMAAELEQILATPVVVHGAEKGRPGRIVIEFFGDEDLTRLYELLTGIGSDKVAHG